MSRYAQNLDHAEIDIIASSSSAHVLSMLKTGKIDIALIGRKAYGHELDIDNSEIMIRRGYTLVAKSKRVVSVNELGDMEIHTHHDRDKVSEILPSSSNVIFHDSLENTIKNMDDGAALLAWEEYNNDNSYDLLIVMDGDDKDTRFRSPFIYYKNVENKVLNHIKNSIGD